MHNHITFISGISANIKQKYTIFSKCCIEVVHLMTTAAVSGMYVWFILLRCMLPKISDIHYFCSPLITKRQTQPARKTDVAKPGLTASLIKFADQSQSET